MISTFLTQCLTALAIITLYDAWQWIETGSGVHPILGGAMTAAFILIAYPIGKWTREYFE